MIGRAGGWSAVFRRALPLLFALACGLVLLALPAGAATPVAGPVISVDESVSSTDAPAALGPAVISVDEGVSSTDASAALGPALISVDESVSSTDASAATGPASIGSEEPVGTIDAVRVLPPSGITADEPVSIADAVRILPPAGVVVDESVSTVDAITIGVPASIPVAETAGVSDEVSITVGSSATRTVVTAGPNPALAGTPVQLHAVVTVGSAAVGSGLVTFEDGATPLGPAVPVDASGQATLTVSNLSLGTHSINANYGGTPSFDASSDATTEGIYDYGLALVPTTQTVQRGATASFTLSSTLTLGSSTTGIPASIGLTTSPGATAGQLALPGSTTVTVPTNTSTPAGAQTVSVTGDPGSRTASATLYVNVPPVPSAGGPYNANEGSTVALHGSATDTAGETLTYSWDLGGGVTANGPSPTMVAPDGPSITTVGLTVCDDHGGCASDSTTLTTVNVPPTATLQGPASAPEGSVTTISLTGAADPSAADVAAGLHFAFSCDGTSLAGVTYASASTAASTSCLYADGPGSVTVRARVIDKDGGFTELTRAVLVTNVAPSVRILAPPDGSAFGVGSHIALSGSFTDPGTLDTHQGTWTVGGMSIPATIVEHGGSGTAGAIWTPSAAGFYPFSLTLIDKDGGTTNVSGGTLVVFDRRAGSVTGAGTILDPDHNLVLFGFTARYFDSDLTPRGSVDLRLPHLHVSSTHLDWLVVTAPSFELQGTGRGNGTPGYRFRLSAVTGRPDHLRVRVWSPGGALVYDSTLRPLRFGDISIIR